MLSLSRPILSCLYLIIFVSWGITNKTLDVWSWTGSLHVPDPFLILPLCCGLINQNIMIHWQVMWVSTIHAVIMQHSAGKTCILAFTGQLTVIFFFLVINHPHPSVATLLSCSRCIPQQVSNRPRHYFFQEVLKEQKKESEVLVLV